MNTGKALETKRIVLVPGNNARDDEPFMQISAHLTTHSAKS